ncbi:MAG: TolC family protein [Nitrospirota bacterium]|nr:TolC family protein [Nitrospirota bacterium]MDH5699934.1 TolC family protein [Nitrospirota bacterium]
MVYRLIPDSILRQITAVLVPFAALRFMLGIILMGMLALALSPQKLLAKEPSPSTQPAPTSSLSLSVSESVSLFLKQNLDLLMTKYGIDDAKGLAITAKLFPNPVFSLFGGAAFTQQQTFKGTRYLSPQIEQMFLLAGKRGYRIESAGYGIQAAEATFTDAIRQLTLTLKDTYFQVQLASRRLDLAKDNQERFHRILTIGELRFKKGFIAEVDLIRLRLQAVDFGAQVIRFSQEVQTALNDLRLLLALPPTTDLALTSDLVYTRVTPDIDRLRTEALDKRPDLQARRFVLSQQQANLKLAKSLRVPDPIVGGSFTVQGPQGGSNQQLYGLTLEVPLPVFDRNQGGIAQAEIAMQVAQVDLHKTTLEVQNDIEVTYRNLTQSQQLVEAYQAGVLDDARITFSILEKAYQKGGVTLLDVLDAARTSQTILQNYLEALFEYQRNLFLLERAAGQDVTT